MLQTKLQSPLVLVLRRGLLKVQAITVSHTVELNAKVGKNFSKAIIQ